MNKKYIVDLQEKERLSLRRIIRSGSHSARKIRWAHTLLKADSGWKDCGGSGPERANSSADPTALRRAWLGDCSWCAHPQAKAVLAETGWQAGGETDRPCLQQGSGRQLTLDPASAGRENGGASGGRACFISNGSTSFKKTL